MTTTTRTTQAGSDIQIIEDEPTGWVGWIGFAAVVMIIAGILQTLHGFVAVVNDDWVVFGNQANLYLDLTAWGWVHIGIGAILLLSGIGVMTGNVLARAIGVVVASISLIANFLYLPAYPIWALVVIAIDIMVIYALTAHGREMRRV
jgi:hypothetical protein